MQIQTTNEIKSIKTFLTHLLSEASSKECNEANNRTVDRCIILLDILEGKSNE